MILRQSTAYTFRIGPFRDRTDGVTEETALSLAATDVQISKAGGAFANKNSATAPTHDSDGWYICVLDTTDTNTVGTLEIKVQDNTKYLPVSKTLQIVEEAVYDAMYAASAAGPLQSTTAGRTLDVTVGGCAGIDWANVEAPTTTLDLSATSINLCDTITTYTGNTLQTGDTYALANGAAGFTAIDTVVDAIKVKTDFLPSATAGNAGGVFIAGTNAATTVTTSFTSTFTGNLTGAVGSVTGNVGGNVVGSVASVTGGINTSAGTITTLDALDTAQDAQHSTTQTAISNLNDIAITDIVSGGAITTSGGAVSNVTLVATTTTNADMRGTNNAFLAASAPTNFSDLAITATTGLVDITQTAADKAWSSASRVLTAATNITSDASAIGMSSSGVVGTVNLINTLTTYTGNTLQTADVAARVPNVLNTTATGNIGIDWANVENPTTALDLSGTDIQLCDTATTVTNRVTANSDQIAGNATSATNLSKSAIGIEPGTAITGTLSTTQMTTDLTEATDDHYNGRIIVWTSGVLKNQATDITDYTGATKLLTYTATTEAPSNADTFVIV